MRQWLELSDLALVQKIDSVEKYGSEDDPALSAFTTMRAHFSRIAWNSYASALDCDRGPLAATGVIWRPIEEGMGQRLLTALLDSPETKLRRDDFACGYSANIATSMVDYLNSANEYREVTVATLTALRELLAMIGPEIEETLGHPFRICSTRQFQLRPTEKSAGRHLDGWPVSIRKMFILPQGVGPQSGTTWFRLRNGQEITLNSDRPIWAIFENSVVWHAPVAAQALRPTIELDLVPASKSSFVPYFAGINGWYPWFPTGEGLLEGTRTALALQVTPQESRKTGIMSWRRMLGDLRFSRARWPNSRP